MSKETPTGIPVAVWLYMTNNTHTLFSTIEPPSDAYDAGTLAPLVLMADAQAALAAKDVEIEGLRKDAELRNYLQPADLGDLMRFQETTDDSEGYDIGKPAIRRLVELGVVQSHGFGTYSMTAFGHFAMEHMFKQSPLLPLMTNDDRDRAAKAKETTK